MITLTVIGLTLGGSFAYCLKKKASNLSYKVEKIIDFNMNNDKVASNILTDYLLEMEKDNEVVTKELIKYSDEACKAHFVDLNDDGVDEIIGAMFLSAYSGTAGVSIFILQKQDGNYREIFVPVSLQPDYKIYILSDKTNNYKDFVVYIRFDGEPTTLKFDGKNYLDYKTDSSIKKAINKLKNTH